MLIKEDNFDTIYFMAEPTKQGSIDFSSGKKNEGEGEKKGAPTYPLIKFADIPEDTKQDIIDLITGTLERYSTEILTACKLIKEAMDRLYGPGWHVIIGEHFGYDVNYQRNHLLYMFFLGNLGILVWKCS